MSDYQKFIIRAPEKLSEQAASLAAIHYLAQSFPAVKIDVIVSEGGKHLYDYCLQVNRTHFLPKDKDGVLAVFPWVHNNKDIFNIDVFVDFLGGATGASLGIALKAKRRLGFATPLTKPMLTDYLERESIKDQFIDEQFLTLCQLLQDQASDNILHLIKGKVPSLNEKEQVQVASLGKFLFVAIRASLWHRHENIWRAWFDAFKENTLVVVIDRDENNDKIEEDLQALKSENFMLMTSQFTHTNLILMSSACGILTDSCLFGNLAPYYGIKSALLAFDLEEYPSFKSFHPRPEIFLEREKVVTTKIDASGKTEVIDTQASIDGILKLFKI